VLVLKRHHWQVAEVLVEVLERRHWQVPAVLVEGRLSLELQVA